MQPSSTYRVSCLHPRQIVNRRYISAVEDYSSFSFRVHLSDFQHNPDYYVIVPCGKCILCRKRRANDWRIRLMAECGTDQAIRSVLFLTFTFRDEKYQEYLSYDKNGVPQKSVLIRRWRQNFKNKYGYSPRYFLTEDCGSQFGRIHLHGFLFNPPKISITQMRKDCLRWDNGFVDISFCKSLKAVSYACGYITGASLKKDAKKHNKPICEKARKFIPKIFVSKGLGASFVEKHKSEYRSRKDNFFAYRNGIYTVSLPRYLRQKIWTTTELDWIKNDYLIQQYEDYLNFNFDSYKIPFNGKILSPEHFRSVAKELIFYYEDLPDNETTVMYDRTIIKTRVSDHTMTENTDFDFKEINSFVTQTEFDF